MTGPRPVRLDEDAPAPADLFDHLAQPERDCRRFGHDFEDGITCQCCGLVDL